MMQKLGFPSFRSLDQFRSRPASASGTAKTSSFSSRPSTDSLSIGSFANLKLTAEKLVKEQASVKTDLEMATLKLKKSTEHIRTLEDKLQNAFNENAKLKVRQKEDEKLWKGLESKFSSTKTLCDQLTETLQHLAGQVQNAEKDKEFFDDKLSASSVAIDGLNQQMAALSMKLESAEETIQRRDKELMELGVEKEEREKFHRDEQCRTANLIEEKDATIKKFQATLEENAIAMDNLNSTLGEVQSKLISKEDEIKQLITTQQNLEKDKKELQLRNEDLGSKLVLSLQEIKSLERLVHLIAAQLAELNKKSSIFPEKFDQLNSLYESCFKLVQKKTDVTNQLAKKRHNKLLSELLFTTSEKDALQMMNQELNSKVTELQKSHVVAITQLAEELRISCERIQCLESEAETLVSRRIESESLVCELEQKISSLLESAKSSEDRMQDLLVKYSALESEKDDDNEKSQAEIQKKAEEIQLLQDVNGKIEKQKDALENQVEDLKNVLEEKENFILSYKDREKKLEDQISENQALLTSAEHRLAESKKQYDMMLDNKKMELSRHLKELCQKNDQAINDIRRKFELEKQEIVNQEKEKVDRVVGQLELECDKKLSDCKEESRQHLISVQEEHAALVNRIHQENNQKELLLKTSHNEEMKHAQIQAENELRERTTALRNEHEAKMKAVQCQYEDECRKLQEELDRQKSKEDRQRALLQLQWRVMADKPQEDQEVSSRKEYSITSMKKRNSNDSRRSQQVLRPEDEEQDSPLPKATQTPVSKLLKKVENTNTGSVASIPKHSKKVTHREYEVETTNGRTITKRRKTKSTVMFEDPRKHKRMVSPRLGTPKDVKGVHPPCSSNIGDLFTEGSLNPYVDDPYAFD
ncbi:synaptonemal complex protein 1-like isoform X2 [Rhodamnia argentea]|uniref:Synaptonemal complex protein 1-like isoform X2 n=1 Tax=Rhodamnia argentea TaxID=178133 RepID=A0A8B8Q6I4_9MYRT|nr:synaptonemal complex protein 1-like isoform X2 [Rhodamnia argentea]